MLRCGLRICSCREMGAACWGRRSEGIVWQESPWWLFREVRILGGFWLLRIRLRIKHYGKILWASVRINQSLQVNGCRRWSPEWLFKQYKYDWLVALVEKQDGSLTLWISNSAGAGWIELTGASSSFLFMITVSGPRVQPNALILHIL